MPDPQEPTYSEVLLDPDFPPTPAGLMAPMYRRDPQAMFSVSEHAAHFELNVAQSEALRRRLEGWRERNPGSVGWIEDHNATSEAARYRYKVALVDPMIGDILWPQSAPGRDPA